ncbi:MAG: hypothetical protein ACLGHN_07780 [Bacteriovoracia bacterium]
MNSLQQMFPSLTLFSDLDWEAVTQEYESQYIDLSFPEYLQQKALDGDCPPYLFELAYYELALFDARTSVEPFPFKPGVYLNPTALFLKLEFDVKRMIDDAVNGNVEVYEKPHVLCLYRDQKDKIHAMEMSDEDLSLLQNLEDGPQSDRNFVEKKNERHFKQFKEEGLILDLLSA